MSTPPSPAHNMPPPTTDLIISCLLIDSERKITHGDALSVRVQPNATIEGLKEAVKLMRPRILEDVDLAMLTVWRCMDPKLRSDMSKTKLQNALMNVDFNKTDMVNRPGIQKKITALDLSENEILLVQLPASEGNMAVGRKRTRLSSSSEIMGEDMTTVINGIMLPETDPFSVYWRTTWKCPLSTKLTTLPEKAADATDDPCSLSDGDLLPDRPTMTVSFVEEPKGFLVRAEYIRVYNFIEKYFARDDHKLPPAVVVTGQPGIGKTVWILYALSRRLGNGQPTLYYSAKTFYLFSDERVKIVPHTSPLFRQKILSEIPWCLVDSESSLGGLPVQVSDTAQKSVYPIYVTPPQRSRWKRLNKTKARSVVVMNPWSWEEIDYVTRDFDPARKELVRQRFHRLGPVPRICFSEADDSVTRYEADARSYIARAKNIAELLSGIIQRGQRLDTMEEGSAVPDKVSQICLLRRQGEIESMKHSMHFTSDCIEDLCAKKLLEVKEEVILDLWRNFSPYGDARGMTGVVFECYMQRTFRKHVKISGEQMFQISQQGNYHAPFSSFSGQSKSKEAKQGFMSASFVLDLRPNSFLFDYNVQALHVQPDIYYQPKTRQLVGIDSFLVHDNHLYLFQMTGSKHHDIKDKLKCFLDKLVDIPPKSDWRFVFVLPDDLEGFNCPKPNISVGTLFTARINMSIESKEI